MITVKDAVARASKYLSDVFPGIVDLQLEEVELSDNETNWSVTLSYLRPVPLDTLSPFEEATKLYAQLLGGTKYERVYKLVSVDAASGDCHSIKIRQLQ